MKLFEGFFCSDIFSTTEKCKKIFFFKFEKTEHQKIRDQIFDKIN